MKIELKRFTTPNADFRNLIEKLDQYLTITDKEEHAFYDQFNSIEKLEHIAVGYNNHEAVGCGAFRPMNENQVEIKRMFVQSNLRGKGIAKSILNELESWASESGYHTAILETGKRQKEAVSFYKKMGYQIIPNYGQYKVMENSICFEKTIGK